MSKPTLEEILAQNTQLSSDLTAATTLANEAQSQVTSLTTERDSLKAENLRHASDLTAIRTSLASVSAERDTLKADNDRMKNEMSDFNKRLAAELVKHGVNPNATHAQTVIKTDKKLSLDEQVAIAKGAQIVTK